MKKLLMIIVCLLTMIAASLSAKAQEITINLLPGWTWISYPRAEVLDIYTALGDFVPMEGDIIKSQFSNSTYSRGMWIGGVTHFMPGWGYKYYSNRTEVVSFVFAGPTPQSQVHVTTSEPMLITGNSAMGGGEVTVSDGTYILVRGLCWATHENPTTNEDFYQEAESGVGTFSVSMTELNIATTYYVRAYAVTPNGTVYGDQKTFTTRDGIPILTTAEVTNILGDGATSGGTVTDNGGLNVITRGVCWSTSQNPTLSDSHTTNGSGIGNFTSSITGLSVSTTYYVRAYASTSQGTAYGEEVSFTTRDGIPIVTTAEVTNILGNRASCGGTVTDNGGLNVTARGVCWSTSPNPTVSDSHTIRGSGTGSFTSSITNLEVSTTYYVRAYATTNAGTGYGNEQTFTTRDGIPQVSASVTAVFEDNANCIITLTDNGGFNILECGVCWSTIPNPTLDNSHVIIDDIGVLPVSYTCAMTELSYNTTYYVRAFATNQYTTAYSTERSFTTTPQVWTNGILPGTFSVSESQQVHFSQGNLQYQASTNIWRFAGSQWRYLGGANNNISSTYDGWIDLFGWGTSGYNHGAICYQPWSTSDDTYNYHPYGSWTFNLYDQSGQADWGYNPISNGGNQPNQWRTLTCDEWYYVLRTRSTPSGILFVKATVKGINGVILLPDNWTSSIYALNDINNYASSFTSNVITSGTWMNVFEPNGAVFLPAAGRRVLTSTGSGVGYYWSASKDSSITTMARCLYFENTYMYSSYGKPRNQGYSVRLVCPAE